MKNTSQWQPTKFIYRRGRLLASRDTSQVALASRIMADAVARAYEQYVPAYVSGSLLDLGCGKAPLFGAYQKYVSTNTCVDWGRSLHNNPYTDVSADLNRDLPFADASFDTIVLSDVIEHIYHPHKLWGEMSRVLRPGGHLLLNTPFYYSLHEAPNDYFRLTEFSLRRMSRDSGLVVVRLATLGGAFAILGDLTTRMARRIPHVGQFLALLTYSMVHCCLKTSWGQKTEARTAGAFPFGYFVVSRKLETTKPSGFVEPPPETVRRRDPGESGLVAARYPST